MNIALWVVAAVLAALFLGSGLTKLTRSREQLVEVGMGFVRTAPMPFVRFVGAVEVLGALGLVLPAVTSVATPLVGIAAAGLAVVMAGAVVVHVRAGERGATVWTSVLLVLAVLVAWGRLGPYGF